MKRAISPQQHVQDGRKESLEGYVATFSKDLPPDGNGGVFALDCEMVRRGLLPVDTSLSVDTVPCIQNQMIHCGFFPLSLSSVLHEARPGTDEGDSHRLRAESHL